MEPPLKVKNGYRFGSQREMDGLGPAFGKGVSSHSAVSGCHKAGFVYREEVRGMVDKLAESKKKEFNFNFEEKIRNLSIFFRIF
jgi:hypothetical protein